MLALSGTFEQLLAYVIFVQWIFLGLAGAAVIVLRRRHPDLPRPYRTWGYPVTPILFVAAADCISVNSIILHTWNAAAGLGLVLLGMPAYFYWRRGLNEAPPYRGSRWEPTAGAVVKPGRPDLQVRQQRPSVRQELRRPNEVHR